MIVRRAERYPIESWGGRIRGHPAFILGNGPSLLENDLSLLDGCFSIGINRIYQVYDPTILLWQDKELSLKNKKAICDCSSIKVCRDRCNAENLFTPFSLSGPSYRISDNPSCLFGYGCSGALGIEMAVAMGAESITLLGIDCDYTPAGETDFYGKNKSHNRFTLKNFHNAIRWAADNCPVPIYCCGRAPFWPRYSLLDVMKILKPVKLGRLQWRRKLRSESVAD